MGESEVKQSNSTKLLGMQVQNSQNWNEHIEGMMKNQNQRLFQIRRITNCVSLNTKRAPIDQREMTRSGRTEISVWSPNKKYVGGTII